MAVNPSTLNITEGIAPTKYGDANSMVRDAKTVHREVVSIGSPHDDEQETFLLPNADGSIVVVQKPATSGGVLTYRDIDLDESSPANIKASAGQVYGWIIFNNASTTRFVKLYDKASAPSVGSDTPKMTIPVPPGALTNVAFSFGIPFTDGIGWAATTGVADADTGAPGANDVVAVLLYV